MVERKKPKFAKEARFKVSAAAIAKHKAKKNANPIIGLGADKDFLPKNIRNELTSIIATSDLDDEQQKEFIRFANHLAQMPSCDNASIDPQRKAIQRVSKAAHGLLNKLNALGESASYSLVLHSREACIEHPSPIPFDVAEKLLSIDREQNLLDEAWDWISAIEAAANFSDKELEKLSSQQNKVTEAAPRGLVANLAAQHYRLTEEAPSEDNNGWFAKFARTLGTFMGVHFEDKNLRKVKGKPFMGEKIIASGIEQAIQGDQDLREELDRRRAEWEQGADARAKAAKDALEAILRSAARSDSLAEAARAAGNKALAAGDKKGADRHFARAKGWQDRADKLRLGS